MQGVIMLILITIILLFNFEENISYVFLFFRIPLSFYGLLCFVLERKREKKPYNKCGSRICDALLVVPESVWSGTMPLYQNVSS